MRAQAAPGQNRRNLRAAWVVAGLVLVAGLIVIVGPALRHAGTLFDDPFVGQVERQTVETFDAGGRLTGTVVTTEPAGSWLERSLGPGGVLLLRVAVVAVAAFLAGALVYRTASGTSRWRWRGFGSPRKRAPGWGVRGKRAKVAKNSATNAVSSRTASQEVLGPLRFA